MDTPYEIHILNGQSDLDRMADDRRIKNRDIIMLFKPDRAHQLVAELQAAIEGNPQLIAFVVKNQIGELNDEH